MITTYSEFYLYTHIQCAPPRPPPPFMELYVTPTDNQHTLRGESYKLSNCNEPEGHFGALLKYRFQSLTSRQPTSKGLQEVRDSAFSPNTQETHT